MEFSEKILEDIIWDNAQSLEGLKLLNQRGLSINGKMFRQVDLGDYGRADLISIRYIPQNDYLDIVVYELKKGCITVNALMQAARYVTALRSHGFNSDDWNTEISISICLIGDSIDKNGDFAFLYNELKDVEIYTYDFKLSGIYFNVVGKGWRRTNERINEETNAMLTEYVEEQMTKTELDGTDK